MHEVDLVDDTDVETRLDETNREERNITVVPSYIALWRELFLYLTLFSSLFLLIQPVTEITNSGLNFIGLSLPETANKWAWDYAMHISLILTWLMICRLWYWKNAYALYIKGSTVEYRIGVFATKTVRIKFDNITAVESSQTLIDKFFGVGKIEIASSGTAEMEIRMRGIKNPDQVAELLKATN